MKTIKILPPLSLTDFNDNQNEKVKDKFTSKKVLLLPKIAILIFFCFIVCRVPYLGSFFDNLVDLFFGPIKYCFYLIVFIFLLLNTFKGTPIKKLIKKKSIVSYFLLIFLLCCFYTSIWTLITQNNHNFKESLINYSKRWINYFHANKYEIFFNNSAAGIIPLIFVLTIFLFLKIFTIILFAVLTTLIVLTLVNANYKKSKIWVKIANFLTKKIGMVLKIETIEEIKKNKTNFKFKKITKKRLKKTIGNLSAPFFGLLPQNNINNQPLNQNDATNIKNKIIAYLLQEKITITDSQLQVFSNYTELSFTCSSTKLLTKIVNNINAIFNFIKINHFNYDVKDLTISFQFANKYPTKKSLALIASDLHNPKPFDTICCYTLDNKPFVKNLLETPNTLVIGKKLSGAVPFVILYCLNLCLTAPAKDLEIFIFLDNPQHLFNELFFLAPHIKNNVFSNLNEILIKLKMIIEELKNRMNLFKENNVTSLSSYNKIINVNEKKLKTFSLVFNDLDLIVKNESASLIWQNLFYILENGKKYGINCLIAAQTIFEIPIMNKLLKLVDSKFIYALNNEYESIQLFNDNKCIQLFGSGDCYYFDKAVSQKHPLHLQTCYITKNELEYDLTLIKNFYALKENNL